MNYVYLFSFRDEDGTHWVTDLNGGSVLHSQWSNFVDGNGARLPSYYEALRVDGPAMACAIAAVRGWAIFRAEEDIHATGDFLELKKLSRMSFNKKRELRDLAHGCAEALVFQYQTGAVT